MKKVVIESPFAGDVEKNLQYARAALLDSLSRGEAPIASHLLYTQVLDDTKPEERALGIEAGLLWAEGAEVALFYVDLGFSPGMKGALKRYEQRGTPVEFRSLPGWRDHE